MRMFWRTGLSTRPINIILLTLVLFVSSAKGVKLNLDKCRFKGENGDSFMELYLEIPRHALIHKADSSGWCGAIIFEVVITSDKVLLARDHWFINDVVTDPEDIDPLQNIIDVRRYRLSPGQYNFSVTAIDSLSKQSWSADLPVEIGSYPDDEPAISDIELASHLIPPDVIEKFDRDEFGLIPVPSLLFGGNRPYFIYYLVIYPPAESEDTLDFTVQRSVVTGFDDAVVKMPEATYYKKHDPFWDADSVLLEGLSTGSYAFIYQIISSRGDTTVQSKRFFIYRDDIEIATPEPALDSLEVESEFREIRVLQSREEYKQASSLTIPEKARYIRLFWQRYDDDPGTPEIPFRLEFRDRVREADRRWTNSRQEGHETDRGRIFILHGEPDNRETHFLDRGTKPYEIWIYDRLEGGVLFVFIDRNGQGEFPLAHSTMRGEIQHPNWFEDYVTRGGVDSRR